MKKTGILFGTMFLASVAFSQRPQGSNPFSLEGGLSLNTLENTFSAPSLKLRYFATDNIAARVGIMYNSTKTIDNIYGFDSNGDLTADSLGTSTARSSQTMISIGGSYHFSQLDRLSPYVSLDVMFGMGSEKEDWVDYDGTDYVKGVSANNFTKNSSLGVGLGAGFDYYFAENVFIGAELGMLFLSTKDKGGESSTTVGGTTNTNTILPTGSGNAIGNNANASIRLGWRF